jgi:hypothetical protein
VRGCTWTKKGLLNKPEAEKNPRTERSGGFFLAR